MNGRYLLDTNVLIRLFAHDGPVEQHLAEAAEVLVSSVAMGELYYGARKSARITANTERLDALAATVTVLGCDLGTAREYGRIKDQLRAKGRPVPENDLWIAAQAMQHQLSLVTRDDHFSSVDALSIADW